MIDYKLGNNENKAVYNDIVMDVIEVSQKDNVFYIGKVKAKDLVKIATVHVRGSDLDHDEKYLVEVKNTLEGTINIDNNSDEGIQRLVQVKRLKEISEYLKTEEGFLPNNIIVALNNKIDWKSQEKRQLFEEDGYKLVRISSGGLYKLCINSGMVDAFIVDGQHRLGGFAYASEALDDYELPVSIFIEMKTPLQAELFSVINGKQKAVNKSLLYDLREFGKNEYDYIIKCHVIAKWFNKNSRSPFYKKVKMLGTGYGSLSQSAFIDELVKYVRDRREGYEYKSIFKDKNDQEIIKILYNYFMAVRDIYGSEVWDDTEEYVLTRTTGYGALMKALYYVYIVFLIRGSEFTRENLKEFLQPIVNSIDFSVLNYGKSAGQGLQSRLSKDILSIIIGDNKQLKNIDDKYKEYYKSGIRNK